MSAGDYTKNIWQNGPGVGHPPIDADNLNNIENKLYEIDQYIYNAKQNFRFSDLKKYFWQRNCKEIHMFDDYTAWTPGPGTTVASSSSPYTGNEDVYFKDSDGTGSTILMHDTISPLDLTKFNDGEASSTDDIIAYSVYLFNYSYFTGMTLRIGADSSNYFYYTWNITEGWQVTFQAKKSDFIVGNGAPSWDNIAYIELRTVTSNGATAALVISLALMMFRNDTANDGVANPFQYYNGSAWTNFFSQSTPLWNLLFDPSINDLGIQLLNDYNDSDIYNGLKVKSTMSEFYFKSIMHAKYSKYTNNMTWYVDSNNYATTYLDNNDFKLIIVEGGASTPYTYTLSNGLIREILEIKLEKNNNTIKATLEKGNEKVIVLEHETTIDIDDTGDLYFGYDTLGLCFITDFEINNKNNINLDNWNNPKIVIKKTSQSTNGDTTMDDDNELFVYLPPNFLCEINLNLAVSCVSNTPDIKIDWASNNVTLIGDRFSIGPASSITSVQAAAATKHLAINSLSYDNVFGLDGDGTASIKENFVVAVGNEGGYLKLRWAQNTSDANPISVGSMSFIKVTKLGLLQENF
jgi:hypothetical protein